MDDISFQDAERMINDIMKRLGNDQELEKQLHSKTEIGESDENEEAHLSKSKVDGNEVVSKKDKCSESTIQAGKIIKASESVEAGADFIDSTDGVKSNALCNKMCCENSKCDVSVYQAKDTRTCYLFNCAGKCSFKKHADYFVNTRAAKDTPGVSHSEHELQGLADADGGTGRPDTADGSESSSEEHHSHIRPHTVALTEACDSDVSCEDPHAGCHDSVCQCHKGYYDKHGICRQQCPPETHYECFNQGRLSIRGPDCVPLSQVCDDIMQCADSSDEYNCEAKQDAKEDSSSKSESSKASSNEDTKPVKSESEGSSSSEESHEEADKSEVDKTPEKNPIKASKTDKTPKKTPAEEPKINKIDKEAPTKTTKADKDSTKDKAAESADSDNEPSGSRMFMEKVIISSHSDSSQDQTIGPIIALSLGLAFTLILLGLVGCRLRSVRTRLRKGRPLSQNEADYLINGMYL